MRIHRNCVVMLVTCLVAMSLSSCGGSSGPTGSASEATEGASAAREHRERATPPNTVQADAAPPKGRPIQWKIIREPREQTVRMLSVSIGWCPDIFKRRPKISGVREVDLTHAIVLTAYLLNRPRPGCAEVATEAFYVVRLRQNLRGRPLYDGSQSPPKKRWPR